jgi:CheY-like chemotaxis protein
MTNNPGCDVLIVEDDVIQCEEMAECLGRAGLAVQMAHSGSSALRRVAALQPRVALLDYNLPDTTGVELAARLRALLPDAAIILMSGRIEGLPQQILETIGIKVFVNKPLPLRVLRHAVLKLVRSASIAEEAQHQQRNRLSADGGGIRR